MTRLEKILNDYYATEGLSIDDFTRSILNELDEGSMRAELRGLLIHLNAKV